jgi:predicted transcriptional regulator
MRTLTIAVEPDTNRTSDLAYGRALRAFETGEYQGEFLTFSLPEQLFRVFPPKRWELVNKLQKIGPSSIRGLARALGRDVKRVHEDVTALLAEGIIERSDDKKLFVPYAKINIEFSLFDSKAA